MLFIVSVLGQHKVYTVKYIPSSEGVAEGEAWGNSWRRRGLFDRIYQVESQYEQYIILIIIRLMITSIFLSTISPYTP